MTCKIGGSESSLKYAKIINISVNQPNHHASVDFMSMVPSIDISTKKTTDRLNIQWNQLMLTPINPS